MDFKNHQVLQPNSQVIKLFCNFNQPFREWSPFWRSSKNKSFWFHPVSECAVPSTWKISSFLVNSCSCFKVTLIQPSLIPAYHPICFLSSTPTSPADHWSTTPPVFIVTYPHLSSSPSPHAADFTIHHYNHSFKNTLSSFVLSLSEVFTPQNTKLCQIQPHPFSRSLKFILNSWLWYKASHSTGTTGLSLSKLVFLFSEMIIFTSSCMYPSPTLTLTLPFLIYASWRKSEAIRMKHPPPTIRSTNVPAPVSIFSLVLSTCDLEPVPSWLLNITAVLITICATSSSSSINIKTCLYYLLFNIPWTPMYLLWLPVYAHLYNKQKSPRVSWLLYPQFLESTPARLSPPTF